MVGQGAAQRDGSLQLGASPVEPVLAERQDAQLVVEVRLLGDLAGKAGGLLAGAQHPLPGAPGEPRGEDRGDGAGEQDGGGLAGRVLAADEGGERGEYGVGLRGGPLGGDRGVAGPPGVVLGGGVGALALVGVPLGGELLGDARGEAVAVADRGDQAAVEEFGEGGVGVGVADQGREVGLVRHLAAERVGEAEGGAGRLAEPGGEQSGGGGALGDGGQRRLGRARLLAQQVALVEQGARLDEPQRQPLGLEPEVAGPGDLVVAEGAAGALGEQGQPAGAADAVEDDLLDAGLLTRRRHLGGAGEQDRALGGRGEEGVEGGAADLGVVDEDHGPDLPGEFGEEGWARTVRGEQVDGGAQGVQQLVGGAVVAVEPDDAVGGEPLAAGGDGVQQHGTAGAAGAGEADGAAPGEELDEGVALAVAFRRTPRRPARG
ncbi:hypothetical protein [Streptomyces albidoflavus]|uniref:hypothetical protein n=1 Tax=Streptomyces albidoflavus TaxID=1886 RepID=UPI0015C7BB2F